MLVQWPEWGNEGHTLKQPREGSYTGEEGWAPTSWAVHCLHLGPWHLGGMGLGMGSGHGIGMCSPLLLIL